MGILWLLAGTTVAVLIAGLFTRLASTFSRPDDRHRLRLAATLIPALLLGASLAVPLAMYLRNCPWYSRDDRLFVELAAAIACGLVLLAAIRRWRALVETRARLLAVSVLAAAPLRQRFDLLAARMRAPATELRLVPADRPLAFSVAWPSAGVVLSTWMVEQLDGEELEGVIAHELAHLSRHDQATGTVAATLMDAWSILLSGWQRGPWLPDPDRELACDEVAARVTGRPGALASALYKVWQHGSAGTSGGVTSSLGPSAAGPSFRLAALLDPGYARTRPRRDTLVLAALAAMAATLALIPVWYLPFCMQVLCRLNR